MPAQSFLCSQRKVLQKQLLEVSEPLAETGQTLKISSSHWNQTFERKYLEQIKSHI